jgi:hypothetical protein
MPPRAQKIHEQAVIEAALTSATRVLGARTELAHHTDHTEGERIMNIGADSEPVELES